MGDLKRREDWDFNLADVEGARDDELLKRAPGKGADVGGQEGFLRWLLVKKQTVEATLLPFLADDGGDFTNTTQVPVDG